MPDAREQLFAAAMRVLLCEGPDGLTSRAVTTEAGVAKGILHRYFSDFEAFLAALALSHLEHLDQSSAELRATAGSGIVEGNLADALATALTPDVLAIVTLAMSRRELLNRLRLTTPKGIPLLAEVTKMTAAYLTAERGLGRIPLESDVDSLAVIIVGGAHLRAIERDPAALNADDLLDLLRTAIRTDAPRRSRRAARR